MTTKPDHFVGVLAKILLAVGIVLLAASLFGAVFLVLGGAAGKALGYSFTLCLGLGLSLAGYSLLKDLAWSRYVFVALSVWALVAAYPSLSLLRLLGREGEPGLLTLLALLLFSLKWLVLAVAMTFVVFRHFGANRPAVDAQAQPGGSG